MKARGQLVLGELLTVSGGERVWPRPPGGSIIDCFAPCYDADSAYVFNPPLPDSLSQVYALLDARGRVHAILAIHQVGSSFADVYGRWRARFGPPSCGGGTSPQLPTWLDSKTAVVFYGDAKWDSTSAMALSLMDRTNSRIKKMTPPLSCAPDRK